MRLNDPSNHYVIPIISIAGIHMDQDAPTIVVDWTEHIAIVTLLKAVIAATAAQQEKLGAGAGQA